MKSSPKTIEHGIDPIRAFNCDAAEALFQVSELCTALGNAHDPADQARALNALRLRLLEAQQAVAEMVFASGHIVLAKTGVAA